VIFGQNSIYLGIIKKGTPNNCQHFARI